MFTRQQFREFCWWVVLLSLIVLGLILGPRACATTLTGTVKWQGQPFNGYLDIALVYPGTTGSYLVLPGSDPNGHLSIINGQLPPLTVEGNDTLLPRGTFYQLTYSDVYANPLARLNYVITGATYDIGAAVPTPVTTANINFLDLLGIRNFSAINATFTNQVCIGTGTCVSLLGISNARDIMGVKYAQAYAAGTTDCGVNEAEAALPLTGGTIYLQPGSCTVLSQIIISKPLILRGMGQGGGTAVSSVYPNPTTLTNGMPATTLIKVSPLLTTSPNLVGVTFEDFSIVGNIGVGGASAGDCIAVKGNAPSQSQVSIVTLDRMYITNCFNAGLHITDGVGGVSISHTQLSASAGNGLLLDATVSGLIGPVSIEYSGLTRNLGDGLKVNAATVGLVRIAHSTLSSNGAASVGNGVEVASGSTAASIIAYSSTFTDNANAGLLLADGFGHILESSTLIPGVHQQYGVYLNTPTLTDVYTSQLSLKDNNLQGNPLYDLYEAATVSRMVIYPQTEQQGSANVKYNFLAPAAVTTIGQPANFPIIAFTATFGPVTVVSETCQVYTTAVPSTPPSNSTVRLSPAPGQTGPQVGFSVTVNSLIGTTLTVSFCNHFTGLSLSLPSTLYNIQVQ